MTCALSRGRPARLPEIGAQFEHVFELLQDAPAPAVVLVEKARRACALASSARLNRADDSSDDLMGGFGTMTHCGLFPQA